MSSHLAANNIQPIINNDHDMNFNIGIRDDTKGELYKNVILISK